MVFDKIFANFSEKLSNEYDSIRNKYMIEYQTNLDKNSLRKQEKIAQVSEDIYY